MQNNCSKESYDYAGFWVRLAAYTIDMIIVFLPLLAVRVFFLVISSLLQETFPGRGILFHYSLKDIVLYLVQILYFVLMTYYTGTTLGKKLLNLYVISSDDEKLTLFNVIYRETVGRFLSGLFMGIGYIIAGADKEKRGLHDILCDTRVVYMKKLKVYPEHKTVEAPAVQPVAVVIPQQSEERQPEEYVYTPQLGVIKEEMKSEVIEEDI